MKKILLSLFASGFLSAYAQTNVAVEYRRADSLVQQEQFLPALHILRKIEPLCSPKDTLYDHILWYYTGVLSQLEKDYRMQEKFDSSLACGLEALPLIRRAMPRFDAKFAAREYWMVKNIIVSYFGLNQYDKAAKYQAELYAARNKKKLPEGLDEYYNFSFYRFEGKNIWGYEWYPELGDPETEGSFSKIVYYVYSTNPDGSDKDQLYRLHVLKFHKLDNSVKFDYVLTKRLEKAENEASGTLYAYTYNKKIDYVKLQADIREVLKGNYGKNK